MLDELLLVLVWAAVAVFALSLTRGPAHRALWTVFLTLALARTVLLPPVAGVLNAVTTGVDLVPLVHHLLGVIGAGALLRFMSCITAPTPPGQPVAPDYAGAPAPGCADRRPHELTVAVGTSVLLTMLYLAAPGAIEVDFRELLEGPPVTIVGVTYWLVLEVYLGSTLVGATRLFWRLGARARARLLRISLRTMAVGTAINAAFAAVKSGYIVAHAFGARPPAEQVATVSELMLTTAVILAVSGGLGPTIDTARRWVQTLQQFRALYPLWQRMAVEFPDIVLHYPRHSLTAAFDPTALRLRLYRRIIETRDGMLELSNYVPVNVAAEARQYLQRTGADVETTDAVVDAAWVALGLRRLRSGKVAASRNSHSLAGGASIEDEAAWLAAVGYALLHSPHPVDFAEDWVSRHDVHSRHDQSAPDCRGEDVVRSQA